jgi:hypothetical protein
LLICVKTNVFTFFSLSFAGIFFSWDFLIGFLEGVMGSVAIFPPKFQSIFGRFSRQNSSQNFYDFPAKIPVKICSIFLPKFPSKFNKFPDHPIQQRTALRAIQSFPTKKEQKPIIRNPTTCACPTSIKATTKNPTTLQETKQK